ncbi:Hypothetical protein P9303_21371 [Prochlorococcus marinus str. MIT 9303]|uniref:Tetratricopeptide repeat n=1 Tax=Prochlorococcus marinus (strain MIT 9303) TaxID=59922 RepID=A2CBL2_PROM3|nr:Hypothetical protein P9303_21371 [Prochlorococcus marinus str. MIT 9303]
MIDPKLALAYSKRCGAKLDLGHNKGAINDCDKALRLIQSLPMHTTIVGLPKQNLETKKKPVLTETKPHLLTMKAE